jgi:hypothetical protein
MGRWVDGWMDKQAHAYKDTALIVHVSVYGMRSLSISFLEFCWYPCNLSRELTNAHKNLKKYGTVLSSNLKNPKTLWTLNLICNNEVV